MLLRLNKLQNNLNIATNIFSNRFTLVLNNYLTPKICTNKIIKYYYHSKPNKLTATIEKTIHKQLTETILKVSRITKWCSEIKDYKKHGFHKMFEFIKKQDYMVAEPQSFIVDCLKFTNVDLFISGHFGCYDKVIWNSINTDEECKIRDKFNDLDNPIEYYILRFCQKNSKITKGLSLRDQIHCHSCVLYCMLHFRGDGEDDE